MGIFSDAKDRMLERAALAYLNNNLLAPYGRATHLKIDSSGKRIEIEAELKGEAAPLRIEIDDYDLRRKDERYTLTIRRVHSSREWLTALAKNHLCNVPFELPSSVGAWLARAL